MTRRVLIRGLLGALLLAVILFAGTAFRIWQVGRVDDREHADVILVLGAAQYDGNPSTILRARLQHAKQLFQQGVAPRLVTVGGRKTTLESSDAYTEAEAQRRWLVDNGVPSDKITMVSIGSDTLGSLRAAATVLTQHGWHSAVLVSDPWHELRSRTMADDAGMDARTSPVQSGDGVVYGRATEFRYIVRESLGLIYYRLTHASAHD
ncbi:MAG: YdcF family protein [Sciscionella sp.]|nr:YdcF family protein [Sciscionella sp.]